MTTTQNGRPLKDNSRKHAYDREQWIKTKKAGRPKQVFNPETNTWRKV
jgi:hypothetical protein